MLIARPLSHDNMVSQIAVLIFGVCLYTMCLITREDCFRQVCTCGGERLSISRKDTALLICSGVQLSSLASRIITLYQMVFFTSYAVRAP